MDGVDDDDVEDQCGEGVYGQVVVDEILGECGLGVFWLGCVDWVGGLEEGGDVENCQGEDFQWGEEVFDGVQQVIGVEGDGQGQKEVCQVVDEQCCVVFVEQWYYVDFEGYCGGVWNGEQWVDCQVVDCCQQVVGIFVDWMVEGVD